MALSIKFCLERAEEWAEEADRSGLENVRARARRSAAAWRAMADKAIGIEEGRALKAAETALARETDECEPVGGEMH